MPGKRNEKRVTDVSLQGLSRLAYSVQETAHMLGASESTVRQWIYEGKLPAIRKGKGQGRQHFSVPMRSIKAMLDSV